MCHIPLLMWNSVPALSGGLSSSLQEPAPGPPALVYLHCLQAGKAFYQAKIQGQGKAVLSWSLPSQQSLVHADPHERLRHGSSAGTFPSRDAAACRLQWPSPSSFLLLNPETSGALCWCSGGIVATVCHHFLNFYPNYLLMRMDMREILKLTFTQLQRARGLDQ